jgi:hypothetical protein
MQESRLTYYDTIRKVAGSILDEVIESSFDLILPAALWYVVYSASNRKEYQKIFLGVKRGRSVRLIT